MKNLESKHQFSDMTSGTDEVSLSYLNPELNTVSVVLMRLLGHDVNHILACEELIC